jgi:hypothetical protein
MATATPAARVDFGRERRSFFTALRTPELIELPEATYLSVDGEGEPGGELFQKEIGALLSIAYTIKFAAKQDGRDFKVPTFEASWWIEADGTELPPNQWRWQLLMMVPDFVDEVALDRARQTLAKKKPEIDARAVRLERITQGLCVQVLHIGPYSTEEATLAAMKIFMDAQGVKAAGPHHEVYLGDPNRSKPEALKTILRQPVEQTQPHGFGQESGVETNGEKLTCPWMETRTTPPRDGDLMDEACRECPALLRQVDERGQVSYHCQVFRNTFRSPGAATPITTQPQARASWSPEKHPR